MQTFQAVEAKCTKCSHCLIALRIFSLVSLDISPICFEYYPSLMPY